MGQRITRAKAKIKATRPPESVIIGPDQPMEAVQAARALDQKSSPGRKCRWKVLPSTMS